MSEGLLIQILLVLYYGRYSTFSSLTTAVVTLEMTSILDRLFRESTADGHVVICRLSPYVSMAWLLKAE